MNVPSSLQRIVNEFKARQGLSASTQHLAATIHLMNEHRLDKDAALDQSSRSGNDRGIDGWAFSPNWDSLTIYQSKFTEDLGLSLKGLKDLGVAHEWLTAVLCDEKKPDGNHEHSLVNLLGVLARQHFKVKSISLVLLSLSPEDSVQETREFEGLIKDLEKSRLHRLLVERGGGIDLIAARHNFKKGVARIQKSYPVKTFPETRIEMRDGVRLNIAYLSLVGLVRLYRERGIVLFDKNVRLSLIPFKDATNRVVHPMEATFDAICTGRLPSEVFPFYHLGVTIWAPEETKSSGNSIGLASPSVLNGCQTITIADRYLRRLEEKKDGASISKFESIVVLGKIVIGANEAELKEITNSNNRQNPIDNWQLFSNDDIHNRIEIKLEELGVFYERQKGKFKSLSSELEVVAQYPHTNDTCITIPELAQVVTLMMGQMQKAAKFSEIFIDKKTHDAVFGEWVLRDAQDIVYCCNLLKASKRALTNLLHYNDSEAKMKLMNKPITRCHFWQLGMLFGLQRLRKRIDERFSRRLNKVAPPNLVSEIEHFFQIFFGKALRYYWGETDQGEVELPTKKREFFFKNLAIEKGLKPQLGPFQK